MSCKKFEQRRFNYNEDNRAIFKLWSTALAEELKELAIFDFDKPDLEEKETLADYVLAGAHNRFSFKWWDCGKFMIFKVVEIELDVNAYKLYDAFNAELVKLEIKHGIPKDLDKDLYQDNADSSHFFAAIKYILLVTMAYTIESKGISNEKALKYLKVFHTLTENLSKLDCAHIKFVGNPIDFVKGKTTTAFFTDLNNMLGIWYSKTKNVVRLIQEINRAKITTSSHIKALTSIKIHIQRHIYCLLLLNENAKEATFYDLLDPRVQVLLSQIEDKLLPQTTNTDVLDLRKEIDVLGYEKGKRERNESICAIIESKGKTKCTAAILKLYEALNKTDGLLSFIEQISILCQDLGITPYLLKTFNTQELSKDIKSCIAIVEEAFKHNLICAQELSRFQVKTDIIMEDTKNSQYDFSKLDGIYNERCVTRVSEVLNSLYELAEFNNNPKLIDLTTIFKLKNAILPSPTTNNTNPLYIEDKVSEVKALLPESENESDQRSKKSVKLKKNPSEQLPAVIDAPKYEAIVKEVPFSKDCLYKSLGLNRQDVLEQMFNQIKEDPRLQSLVRSDALNRFEKNYLPEELGEIVSDDDLCIVNGSLTSMRKIFGQLIQLLRKEVQLIGLEECTKLNDSELIEYISCNNPKLLEKDPIANLCSTYQREEDQRKESLKKVISQPDFITTYFTHYYLSGLEGFMYKPKKQGLLQELIKLVNMSIQIWEFDLDDNLIEIEAFKCNKDNTLLVTHLLHIPGSELGFSLFERINPPEHIMTQSKYTLKTLLTKTIEDEQLDSKNKLEILEYFCVQKTTNSESGVMAKLSKIEEAERQLDLMNQNMGMHEVFYKECLESVLSYIKAQVNTQNMLNTEVLNNHINLAMNQYFSKEAVKSYTNKSQQNKSQITLQWNGKSYWVDCLINSKNQPEFKLFLNKRGVYYAQDLKGIQQPFKENEVVDNPDCGLKALNVSRQDFVDLLNSAIEKQEHRESLSAEIHTYLNTMHQRRIAVDPALMTDEIAKEFKAKEVQDANIAKCILQIEKTLKQKFKSQDDCIAYLKNNKHPEVPKEQESLDGLVILNQAVNKKIATHCVELATCQAYVNTYKTNKTFWIGRASARLYAQMKEYTLYVFDKQLNNELPVLLLDKQSSHEAQSKNNIIRIVSENGLHFNKLVVIEEEKETPGQLWLEYIKSLGASIKKRLPAFQEDMSVDIYLQDVEKNAKEVKIVGIPSVKDQKMRSDLSALIGQKPELLAIKIRRDDLKHSFDAKTIQFLQDTFTEVEDMTLSIDEPLNSELHTLLYLAVRHENLELVRYLLSLDASVVAKTQPVCNVLIKPSIDINKTDSYVISQDEKSQWVVEYQDDADKKIKIDMVMIPGLPSLLNCENEIEANDKRIKQAIAAYHAREHYLTPLMLAAKKIGFANPKAPLFFSLLISGLNEARQKENLDKYNTFKALSSEVLTPKFTEHFKNYIDIQNKRTNDKSLSRKALVFILDLFGTNRTFDRGIELSTLIEELIRGELEHKYKELLEHGKKLSEHANTQSLLNWNRNSELFCGLMKIIKMAQGYLDTYNSAYESDCNDYAKVRKSKASDVDIKEAVDLKLEEQNMEIQKLKKEMEASARKAEREREEADQKAKREKEEADQKAKREKEEADQKAKREKEELAQKAEREKAEAARKDELYAENMRTLQLQFVEMQATMEAKMQETIARFMATNSPNMFSFSPVAYSDDVDHRFRAMLITDSNPS